MINFDNINGTKLDPEVIIQMTETMVNVFGNPESIHYFGREASVVKEDARWLVADYFNISPADILFFSSFTETVNILLKKCKNFLGINNIICSISEEKKTIDILNSFCENESLTLQKISGSKNLILHEIEINLKQNKNSLVFIAHSTKQFGELIPLKKIAELCKKYNSYFCCDVSLTSGFYPIDLQKLEISFLISSSDKFYGPSEINMLYVNSNISLKNNLNEKYARIESNNLIGISGFSKAFSLLNESREIIVNQLLELKNEFISEILELNFDLLVENSDLCYLFFLKLPKNINSEMIVERFDIEGFAISYVSSENDFIRISISISKYNTKKEIEKFIEVLPILLEKNKITV